MTYQIDKGVPLPSHRGYMYPFREMQVGDSFFAACTSDNKPQVVGRVQSSMKSFARKYDQKYVTRSVDGGIRCWRIK